MEELFMFEGFKEWNENRKLDKEMKRMMRNQFYDYLAAETEAKKAEKKAYDSMAVFGDTFTPNDLQEIRKDFHKIASNPELTEKYYAQVSKQTHEQKLAELKVAK